MFDNCFTSMGKILVVILLIIKYNFIVGKKFDSNRTILSLAFKKKQAIKTSDKKRTKKTIRNMNEIRTYLQENGKSKTSDIAVHIGLSTGRTRAIIAQMEDVSGTGANSNRTYSLKPDNHRKEQ